MRQKLLFLNLRNGDLNSEVVAWALYDGTLSEDQVQMQAGSETEPPYPTGIAALRDGWRVVQAGPVPERAAGRPLGGLSNEYMLEKLVD